uniref:Tyr recombinase domain-containing protein n=1 Tax=Panagrolaimus sp. PS1159 TaxID=55785 RepID=A0AC35GAG7_9BILA
MSALAASTRKLYEGEYAKYCDWRKSLVLDFVISDEELLPLYLRSVAGDSRSKSAIINAAVSFFGKKKASSGNGVSPLLGLVMKSISKKAPVVKHKEQVVQEEVRKFYDMAWSSDRKESRMGTLVLLLYSGYLRPSEALALKKEDLEFTGENVVVSIKKSKRNQNGPVEKVFISRLSNGICPVVILEKWMEKVAGSDFIFPSFSGIDRPWSYDAAQKELKNILEKLDIKKKITLHSFRGSAATAAVEAGCSEAELDRGCRWNASSSKKSYVRATPKSTATVSSILKNIGA